MILAYYIIKEHIAPFLFGLSLIMFIFTMNLFFQMLIKIAGKGIPLLVLIEYFALNLAWIIALAVPMAVLIATLSAFGRMSADGEITALRASGIAPARLLIPALIASIFITVGIGWFNNNMLPVMNHRAKLLIGDITRKKPTLKLEPGTYNFSIPKLVLIAEGVDTETGRLTEITIYDESDSRRKSTVTAHEGELQFIPENELFVLTLYDGEIHTPSDSLQDGWEWTQFDTALFRVPARGMVLQRQDSGYKSDRELSAGEMLKKVAELRGKDTEHNRRRIMAYMVEVHKKFSIPAACIVFILVGAPLGILAHKTGIGVSGGMSLSFFTIYWAFLIAGEKLADRNLVTPAQAMWSPNVLFLFVGFYLLWLAGRRTSLPGAAWVSTLINRIIKQPMKNNNRGDRKS